MSEPAVDIASIAVVGMDGRFPGAANVEELWSLIERGESAIRTLQREELLAARVPQEVLSDPAFVPRGACLEGIDRFDAAFFGFAPREAEETDPQQRLLLECAYHALESAGYAPRSMQCPVGVFVGINRSSYFLNNLHPGLDARRSLDDQKVQIAADKSYAATRIAHALNLDGPALGVDTACSTSLVAVHLACRALLDFQCDMALAGGASVNVPQEVGYWYRDGGILAPDGVCRAFDAEARGTVFGNAVGLVVLKRLQDALDAGDGIVAVIRGSAVNNDAARKVSFWAPGVKGQSQVILAAQQVAGVDPGQITYVDGHGTGTPLGDPVEVTALTEAFRHGTPRKQFCALTSTKPNVGHLEAVAGLASLIRMSCALQKRVIPPNACFATPNPRIDWQDSPFYVNTVARHWAVEANAARIGAVSSFGIGGTNAHVVLEEAPACAPGGAAQVELWPVSAASADQCSRAGATLLRYLSSEERDPADVARTLQEGREHFAQRGFAVVEAGQRPESIVFRAPLEAPARPALTAFLFPGQGSQRCAMFAQLYGASALFREHLDACFARLDVLLPVPAAQVWRTARGAHSVNSTRYTQPVLFAVEYALARFLEGAGLRADFMLGHSLGEYVAACLAGVMSLEDVLRLLVIRGRLCDASPAGAMLAVPMAPAEALALARGRAALAAHNAPALCVLSGTGEAIAAIESDLATSGVMGRQLVVDRAFHSPLLEPHVAELRATLRSIRLQSPARPYVSNLTGALIDERQARDPEYWVQHMLAPVQFAAGVEALRAAGAGLMVEVGPGAALAQLALRNGCDASRVIGCGTRGDTGERDAQAVFTALGQAWQQGAALDWQVLRAGRGRRTRLPGYPFAPTRYWRDAPGRPSQQAAAPPGVGLHEETWTRLPASERLAVAQRIVLLRDRDASCERYAASLRALGVEVQVVDGLDSLESPGAGCTLVIPVDAEESPAPLQAAAVAEQLATLAAGMRRLAHVGATRIVVLTCDACEVSGAECLSAAAALQEAALQVIAAEADIPGASLDVSAAASATAVARGILRAASSGAAESFAVRGEFVWRRSFAALEAVAGRDLPVRRGGVYLITGAAGRIGREFVRHLAALTGGAHLLLTGRRPREEVVDAAWAAELAAANCTFEYRECDVAVSQRFGALLDEWLGRHRRIDGVMHSAGLAAEGLAVEKSAATMTAVLGPKIDALEVLLARLEACAPDFLLLNSSLLSLVGMIGQFDYAAGNRFMDVRARQARRRGLPVSAVNWDAWRGSGMAARTAREPMLGTPVGTGYERLWTQADWMVAGHRILGHCVVPGSAWVDVAASLADQEFGGVAVRIDDLEFPAPLVVPPGGVRVRVRGRRTGDALAGEIVSLDAGRETVHARFSVRVTAESGGAADWPAQELAEVPSAGLLARVHYGEFGAAWNCLEDCRADGARVLARFALGEAEHARSAAHRCHPALWDAATGLLTGAALLRHATDGGDVVYLPRAYRSIRLFRRLGPRVTSYCRRRGGGSDLLLDVTLVDTETRATVAEIEGLHLARARLEDVRAQLDLAGARAADSLAALLSAPIDSADAGRLFSRILAASGVSGIAVTAGPVDSRLRAVASGARAAARLVATRRAGAAKTRSAGAEPPRTPRERQIAALWAEVLGVDEVGRDENFFALGGHSLMATQLAARLRQVFAVELPIEQVLERPTVAALAALLDAGGVAASGAAPTAAIRARGERTPRLSLAQQRLWTIDQREGPNGLYNEGRVLFIDGPLNVDSLRAALGMLLRRHEVLRSSYPAELGAARAVVAPELAPPLEVIDLSAVEGDSREAALSLLNLEGQRPFDLATAPLLRCVLVRLAGDRHVFGLFMHHIVCDGLSLGIACAEIVEGYEAARTRREPRLAPLPVQYFDFAEWQREQATEDGNTADEAYWARTLAGITPLPLAELPGNGETLAGAVHRFTIDAGLLRQLDALARAQATTTFTIVEAAFALLLAQRAGRDDVLMTTPVTERRDPQLAPVIGLFVNSLALRLRVNRSASVKDFIRAAHAALTGALAHQALPFENVVSAASVGSERRQVASALAQLRLVYLENIQPLHFEQLRVSTAPVNRRLSKFELMLTLAREADGARADFEYRTALYGETWIADLAESYVELLRRLAAAPEDSVELLVRGVADAWNARKQERALRQQQARRSGLARLRQEVASVRG